MNMLDEDLLDDYVIEFCYTIAELEGFLLALPGLYNIRGLFEIG